jgi:hypothetical protein
MFVQSAATNTMAKLLHDARAKVGSSLVAVAFQIVNIPHGNSPKTSKRLNQNRNLNLKTQKNGQLAKYCGFHFALNRKHRYTEVKHGIM